MGARRWGALAFVVVNTTLACVGEDASLNGGSSSSPPTGGDGGVTLAPDAAPSLFCPLGCLPPAPAGWTGPSAVYDGPELKEPPPCPPDYPQREVDAYQNLVDAPPAQCACGPATESGSKCLVEASEWKSGACTGLNSQDEQVEIPGQRSCLMAPAPVGGIPLAASVMVHKVTFVPGRCSSQVTTTKPKLTFEKVNVACGLAQIASCEGRPDCTASPTPSAGFTRLCIHKAGDELCPSHDYAVRFVAHRNPKDERECSPCEGPAMGACGSTIAKKNGSGCEGNAQGSVGFGECVRFTDEVRSVDISGLAPTNLRCEASAIRSMPTGTVTLEDPVTFCCNK